MAQEPLGTPVQQKTEPGTPQIPPAPKKKPFEERLRFAEGTEVFHYFMGALYSSRETIGFHKTAKLDFYGGSKCASNRTRPFNPGKCSAKPGAYYLVHQSCPIDRPDPILPGRR
ncbi:hypothetical protein V502_06726 [Pseudogymnoascus sp. VKM F-4520 (FW-2644)]|nr:hypothetical protein V502_06726 [Pseudogymnoascus sp. VKM F-4520 (FW-2644)]